MAHVRLVTRIDHSQPYFRPSDRSGLPSSLPGYRLRLRLNFVEPNSDPDTRPTGVAEVSRRVEAVLDTGAPFTTLGYDLWQPFADEIRFLPQPQLASGQPRRLTVLGGRWEYQLGHVRLAATDGEGRWLPAVWTPTLLLAPAGPVNGLALLGLRTPLLDRRRVRHAGTTPDDLPVWWLEDDAVG